MLCVSVLYLIFSQEPFLCRSIRIRFVIRLLGIIGILLVATQSLNLAMQFVDGLYSVAVIGEYHKVRLGEPCDPHIFAIANNAYKGILEDALSQGLIISGESGSGKTEATKKALQYFAEVAGSSKSDIDQRLLAANPVLEAFGNAKTVRNNNSSRFGKWMEVHFERSGAIHGCRIVNYLLEKSRVVLPAVDERSYHIFYNLCAGATPAEKSALRLSQISDYRYLTASGCLTIPGENDTDDYSDVRAAISEIGMSDQEAWQLFEVVAGILHLGNIDFDSASHESGSEGSCISRNSLSIAAAENASALLGTDLEKLEDDLTSKVLTVRGDSTRSPHGVEKARASVDALAKALYGRMFDWLVNRINQSLKGGETVREIFSIGVLDIFGFEIFDHNSFEQLCINYCNEKLQQHFNEHVFKAEQRCYDAEGIDYSDVEFGDNSDVLDLIESRQKGLLPLLDDEVKFPRGGDENYITRITKVHGNDHPRFVPLVAGTTNAKTTETQIDDNAGKAGVNSFAIRHYAGAVVYNVHNWVEKNKDELLVNLRDLMQSSRKEFISKELFGDSFTDDLRKATPSNSNKGKIQTQSTQFRSQLQALMDSLRTKTPHYVRCIKPNSVKKPNVWEGSLCLQQLNYSGVFEAVRIRQQGFPFRFKYHTFYQRYHAVVPLEDEELEYLQEQDPTRVRKTEDGLLERVAQKRPHHSSFYRSMAEAIVFKLCEMLKTIDTRHYRMGNTMVLYKAEMHRQLQRRMHIVSDYAVDKLQRFTRTCSSRIYVNRLIKLRNILQSAIKQRELEPLKESIEHWYQEEKMSKRKLFEIKEFQEAKALKDRLQEEHDTIQLCRDLDEADPLSEGAAAGFEEALSKADSLGLNGRPEVQKIKRKRNCRIKRDAARKDLLHGTKHYDRQLIEGAMDAVKDIQDVFPTVFQESEVEAASQALKQIEHEEYHLQSLKSALTTGYCSVSDMANLLDRHVSGICSCLSEQQLDDDTKSLRSFVQTQNLGTIPEPAKDSEDTRKVINYLLDWVTASSKLSYTVAALQSSNICYDHIESPLRDLGVSDLENKNEELNLITPEGKAMVRLASIVRDIRKRITDPWHNDGSIWKDLLNKFQQFMLYETLPTALIRECYILFRSLLAIGWVCASRYFLYEGSPSGTVGHMNISSLDIASPERLKSISRALVNLPLPTVISKSVLVQSQQLKLATEANKLFEESTEMGRLYETILLILDVRKSLLQGDPESLKAALTDVDVEKDICGFVAPEVSHCFSELELLELKKELKEALSEDAVEGDVGVLVAKKVNISRLDSIIEQASLIVQNKEVHDLVSLGVNLVRPIRQAVKAQDWDEIWAVVNDFLQSPGQNADRSTVNVNTNPSEALRLVPTIVRKEVSLCVRHAHYRLVSGSLKESMASGGAKGKIGKLDTSDVRTDKLNRSIAQAVKLEMHHGKAADLYQTADVLLRVRELLLQQRLEEAAEECRELIDVDWEKVNKGNIEDNAAISVWNRENPVYPPAASEMAKICGENRYRQIMDDMKRRISTGKVAGSIDFPSVESVETEPLRECLSEVNDVIGHLIAEDSEAMRMITTARYILTIREAYQNNSEDELRDVFRELHIDPFSVHEPRLEEYGLHPMGSAEIVDALKRLQHCIVVSTMEQNLKNALFGSIEDIHISDGAVENLEDALDSVDQIGCSSPYSVALVQTGRALLDVRKTIQQKRWSELPTFLEHCIQQYRNSALNNEEVDGTYEDEGIESDDQTQGLLGRHPKSSSAIRRKLSILVNKEIQFAQKFHSTHNFIERCKAVLRKGYISGEPGNLDTSSVEVSELVSVLASQKNLIQESAETKSLAYTGQCVVELRKAVRDSKYDELEKTLMNYKLEDIHNIASAEYKLCQEELEYRSLLFSLFDPIINGGARYYGGSTHLEDLQLPQLRQAISKAQECSFHTEELLTLVQLAKQCEQMRSHATRGEWEALLDFFHRNFALTSLSNDAKAKLRRARTKLLEEKEVLFVEAQNRTLLKDFSDAFHHRAAVGKLGEIAVETIDETPVEEVISKAEHVPRLLPYARRALDMAYILRDMRKSIRQGHYERVDQCSQQPLVREVLGELHSRDSIDDVSEGIELPTKEIKLLVDEARNYKIMGKIADAMLSGTLDYDSVTGEVSISHVSYEQLDLVLERASRVSPASDALHGALEAADVLVDLRKVLQEENIADLGPALGNIMSAEPAKRALRALGVRETSLPQFFSAFRVDSGILAISTEERAITEKESPNDAMDFLLEKRLPRCYIRDFQLAILYYINRKAQNMYRMAVEEKSESSDFATWLNEAPLPTEQLQKALKCSPPTELLDRRSKCWIETVEVLKELRSQSHWGDDIIKTKEHLESLQLSKELEGYLPRYIKEQLSRARSAAVNLSFACTVTKTLLFPSVISLSDQIPSFMLEVYVLEDLLKCGEAVSLAPVVNELLQSARHARQIRSAILNEEWTEILQFGQACQRMEVSSATSIVPQLVTKCLHVLFGEEFCATNISKNMDEVNIEDCLSLHPLIKESYTDLSVVQQYSSAGLASVEVCIGLMVAGKRWADMQLLKFMEKDKVDGFPGTLQLEQARSSNLRSVITTSLELPLFDRENNRILATALYVCLLREKVLSGDWTIRHLLSTRIDYGILIELFWGEDSQRKEEEAQTDYEPPDIPFDSLHECVVDEVRLLRDEWTRRMIHKQCQELLDATSPMRTLLAEVPSWTKSASKGSRYEFNVGDIGRLTDKDLSVDSIESCLVVCNRLGPTDESTNELIRLVRCFKSAVGGLLVNEWRRVIDACRPVSDNHCASKRLDMLHFERSYPEEVTVRDMVIGELTISFKFSSEKFVYELLERPLKVGRMVFEESLSIATNPARTAELKSALKECSDLPVSCTENFLLIDTASFILRLREAYNTGNWENVANEMAARPKDLHHLGSEETDVALRLCSDKNIQSLILASLEESAYLSLPDDPCAPIVDMEVGGLENVLRSVDARYRDDWSSTTNNLYDYLWEMFHMKQTLKENKPENTEKLDASLTNLKQFLVALTDRIKGYDKVLKDAEIMETIVENRGAIESLQRAYTEGMCGGEVGQLDRSAIKTTPLTMALQKSYSCQQKASRLERGTLVAERLVTLRKSVFNGEWEEAEKTLYSIERTKWMEWCGEEFEILETEIENKRCANSIERELRENCVSGVPGDLDVSDVRTEKLLQAISNSQKLRSYSPHTSLMARIAQVVIDIRSAILEDDWDTVANKLRTHGFNVGPSGKHSNQHLEESQLTPKVVERYAPECDLVVKELQDRQASQKLASSLQIAVNCGMEQLQSAMSTINQALQFASQVGIHSHDTNFQYEVCRLTHRLFESLHSHDWEGAKTLACSVRTHTESSSSLQHLHKFCDTVVQQSRQQECANALKEAVRSGQMSGQAGQINMEAIETESLRNALYAASSLSRESRTAGFDTLLQCSELTLRLRESAKDHSWGEMEECIEEAATLTEKLVGSPKQTPIKKVMDISAGDVWPTVLKEFELAVNELHHRAIVDGPLPMALQQGQVMEIDGALDTSHVELDALDKAISHASSVGCYTHKAKTLLQTGVYMRRLRAAVLDGEWNTVRALLEQWETMEQSSLVTDEVATIRRVMTLSAVEESLLNAIESGSGVMLKPAEVPAIELAEGYVTKDIGTIPLDNNLAKQWIQEVFDCSIDEETDERGLPPGYKCVIDAHSVYTEHLKEAIEETSEVSPLPNRIRELVITANMLLRIRESIVNDDLDSLIHTLEDARRYSLSDHAQRELSAVLADFDDKAVVAELARAVSSGYVSLKSAESIRQTVLSNVHKRVTPSIHDFLEAGNTGTSQLDTAIEYAKRVGISSLMASRLLLSTLVSRNLRRSLTDCLNEHDSTASLNALDTNLGAAVKIAKHVKIHPRVHEEISAVSSAFSAYFGTQHFLHGLRLVSERNEGTDQPMQNLTATIKTAMNNMKQGAKAMRSSDIGNLPIFVSLGEAAQFINSVRKAWVDQEYSAVYDKVVNSSFPSVRKLVTSSVQDTAAKDETDADTIIRCECANEIQHYVSRSLHATSHSRLTSNLKKAIESRDENQLWYILEHMEHEPNSTTQSLVSEAETLLFHIRRCNSRLKAAMDKCSVSAIEAALQEAKSLNLDNEEVRKAGELLNTIKAHYSRAHEAIENFDQHKAHAALQQCEDQRATLPSELADRLRKLIEMRPREVTEARLQKAAEKNDANTVTYCTIYLKTLFFEETRHPFGMHECPTLTKRGSHVFSTDVQSEVGDSLPMVISYQRDHATQAIELHELMTKHVQRFHDSNQGWESHSSLDARNFINTSYTSRDLTNEAVTQLLGAIRHSASLTRRRSLWKLLSLTLSWSTPQDQLENYIEKFLRTVILHGAEVILGTLSKDSLRETGPGASGSNSNDIDRLWASRCLFLMHRGAYTGTMSLPVTSGKIRHVFELLDGVANVERVYECCHA